MFAFSTLSALFFVQARKKALSEKLTGYEGDRRRDDGRDGRDGRDRNRSDDRGRFRDDRRRSDNNERRWTGGDRRGRGNGEGREFFSPHQTALRDKAVWSEVEDRTGKRRKVSSSIVKGEEDQN